MCVQCLLFFGMLVLAGKESCLKEKPHACLPVCRTMRFQTRAPHIFQQGLKGYNNLQWRQQSLANDLFMRLHYSLECQPIDPRVMISQYTGEAVCLEVLLASSPRVMGSLST